MHHFHRLAPKKAYLILKFILQLTTTVPSVLTLLNEMSAQWAWCLPWLDKELNGQSYS